MATKKEEAPTPADLGIQEPEEIKPESTADETVIENPAPRKRGRPAGSRNGASSAASEKPRKSQGRKAEDVDALAKQLQGIHMLASMATGLQEVQISEVESAMLARGITAVTEEYGFALNGKTGAAIQLFGAAAMVYVPRLMIIKARMEAEAKKQKAAENNIVDVSLNPGTAPYASATVN